MKLFLVGWRPPGGVDPGRGRDALGELLVRLPYFDPAAAETWTGPSGRVTLSCVGHEPERLGGVRYLEADDRGMALFSGRPFRWTDDGGADGAAPLDPAFYRRPAGEWAASVDGRCTAIRCDDERGELELYTDPLGAYPLYAGEAQGTRWFSNSAELVHSALDTDELDIGVIASVLGCGFSLRGDPVWTRVRRLPRGTVLRLRAGRRDDITHLLPLERIAPVGGRFEPERSAAALVAVTGALAAWPGRPVLLQLSGGRDSRLVYAAALRAEVEFEVVTAGTADLPDVQIARALCERTGVPHRLLGPDPEGAVNERAADAARIIGATSAGAFSLEDAAGYPLAQSQGPLPLWLGGQGGEIARRYYGRAGGDGAGELSGALARPALNSAGVLNDHGERLVLAQIRASVSEQLAAGVAAERVPDLFYLLNRMASWGGTGFGSVEYGKGDSLSPLWCRGLLPHQLEAAADGPETFHTETLGSLSPELAGLSYAEDVPRRGDSSAFAGVCELVADAVAAQPSHPAWRVLDRRSVEELVASEPGGFGAREVRSVWRLATVFMGAGTRVPA